MNRSFFIEPRGQRTMLTGVVFPHGEFSDVQDSTDNKVLQFIVKVTGSQIKGTLINHSDTPVRVTHRMILFSLKTTATTCWVPDKGLITLQTRRHPLMLRANNTHDMSTPKYRSLFPLLFGPTFPGTSVFEVKQLPLRSPLRRFDMPKSYVTGPAKARLLQDTVDVLEKLNIVIKTTVEPFCMLVFVVKKKAGTARLLVDFRPLNVMCFNENYSTLNRDHVFAGVHKYTVGSLFDLQDAFFQVKLSTQVVKQFGFECQGQLYNFLRFPQGYKNAPSTFRRTLDITFRKIRPCLQPGSQLISYVDYIILLSTSDKAHSKDLVTFLDHMERDTWRMNINKCRFFVSDFDFLGYKLTP